MDEVVKLDVYKYLIEYERPIILQQLMKYGNKSLIKRLFGEDRKLINYCIFVPKYKNIPSIFKIIDSVHFGRRDGNFYEVALSGKKSDFTGAVFTGIRSTLTPRRYQLLLQILWIFFTKDINPSGAENTLRLIWASVPDPIIIFHEIENALKHVFGPEEIKDIYNFYAKSVGIEVSKREPRSLKQLCRTMIRRQICSKDLWLPDIINKFDIPKTLKEFLNLDE